MATEGVYNIVGKREMITINEADSVSSRCNLTWRGQFAGPTLSGERHSTHLHVGRALAFGGETLYFLQLLLDLFDPLRSLST